MAETQRTTAAVYSLLADNTSGDISPQDQRDGFATWRMGHGQMYVAAADAAAITVSDTSSYFEATNPAWTLSGGLHLFDESGGNGRLTYTGTAEVTCHIALSLSMTSASSNQVLHFRIGKSGTTDAASEIQRKVGTGTDVGALAMHLITNMTNGQYLSLWVRNATGANNITVETANLQAVTMPT